MKKKFTSETMKYIRYLSWPEISDSGKRIAYVESIGHEESGLFTSKIFLRETESETPWCFAEEENSSEKQPSLLKDGDRMIYLSDRTGQWQIYVSDLQSGETEKLTTTRHGVTRYSISDDESVIAFETVLWPEEIENGQAFVEMDEEEKAAWEEELEYRPYEVTDLTYKMDEWHGMRKGQLPQAVLLDTGTGIQSLLSDGSLESCFPAVSPDGSRVAFYGYPHAGAKGRQPELFVCGADGSGLRQLTENAGVYADTCPAFTKDGAEIVCTVYPELKDGSAILLPLAVNAATGENRMIISPGEDQVCHGLHPFPTGRCEYGDMSSYYRCGEDGYLYFISSFRGRENLYRKNLYDADEPVETVIAGENAIHEFVMNDRGTAAFLMADLNKPAELHVKAGSSESRQLTDVNGWLREYELPETEEFWVKTDDGKAELQVWLMHPAGQEEGKFYPAVLYIHGGPECVYNAEYWHEFHALADAGIAVIFTNPRGSVGYGRAFCAEGIAWAPEAMDDLITAVRAAVAKGFIDEKRIGVTGGSYGGYMTNKFIGRTDYFAAAVSQRCLINPATSYGTGDMGFISSNPEAGDIRMLDYLTDRARKNAITYIDNMKVPLLLLHGYKDYRCSFEQAEQLFVAMKDRNPEVPVKLVMFPEENHGVDRIGKLYNQIRHLQEMTDWFVKYLGEGGAENE